MVGFFRSPAAPAINFSSSLNIIFLKIFSKCFFASCSADSYCQLTSQSTLKYLICYVYSLFQLDHRTIRSWKSIPYKQNFAVVVSGFSQVQNLSTQLWFWTGIRQTLQTLDSNLKWQSRFALSCVMYESDVVCSQRFRSQHCSLEKNWWLMDWDRTCFLTEGKKELEQPSEARFFFQPKAPSSSQIIVSYSVELHVILLVMYFVNCDVKSANIRKGFVWLMLL